jgi:hypothetical protein
MILRKAAQFLQSPANWCGLGMGAVGLLLSGSGLALAGGALGAAGLAALGYGAGFGAGGLWLGFPKLGGNPWDELDFDDQGDASTTMANAISSVRQLVNYNPDNRLPGSLQTRVLEVCQQLANLLDQWERSKGKLSLEESFHARHIALSYLPDALKTYLSIPKEFATTKRLANGKTAEETFKLTLEDLDIKVRQLTDDLASQDAQAFLNHSQFLHEKFKRASAE